MDYYALLGIERKASEAEIRRAYQKRARALHPHLNPGDPEAAERFDAVVVAFRVLSDPRQRAAYDKGERAEVARPAAAEAFEGFDFSAEVRAERVGFREIFDGVLRPFREIPAARGQDVEERARLTFDEAFRGSERHLSIDRHEACSSCQGLGEISASAVPCTQCRGTGLVRGRRGHMIFSRRCTACDGVGTLHRHPCARCEGEGRVPGNEQIDVRIPAGARSGSMLRLPGCGHAGRRGGPPGDLVLHVDVAPHERFRREGDDLQTAVPVSIVEAAMGGHVEIETPDGAVTIELPAGTQNGHRFRLRKRGMPRLGTSGRGDLYAEVRVSVPTVIDDEGRALLKAFAEKHPQSREALRAALQEEEGR